MKDIAKFIFEVGTLKRIKRGWLKSEGVGNPESVAEHVYRNAMVGYVLAKLEQADADKVMKMCLFHDIPEVRIGDLDKVAQRYIDKNEAELQAMIDQTENLPDNIKNEVRSLLIEFNERETKEAIIARDADVLELLFQAKEYADVGYTGTEYWLEKNSELLKTESAKKLFEELMKQNAFSWSKGLENLK
ncbi:MAG TPA: HD domain-containing protein [Candidatus Aenigmarchaeota archaeon]|nr:HD domain-containing protein [Candidatus Aenigmarchaeota archaeon]